VSGVIALMLEANSSLTWRDVKHILATTSVQVDASRTKTLSGVLQYAWVTNAASHKFHNWYGFGKVNAAAAVDAAKSYTANSLGTWVYATALNSTVTTIADYDTTQATVSLSAPSGSSDIVETVEIAIKLTHAIPNSIGLRLMSPSGTISNILQPYTKITTNPSNFTFYIQSNAFYGESMAGTWTLAMDEYISDGTSGTMTSWKITAFGR
jgi:subtilisin-like proprotein convertase family protein